MKYDDIIQLTSDYESRCNQLLKLAFIKRLPNGKYRVMSEKGKNLGTYKSRDGAKKRLKQIEFFKHLDHSNADDNDKFIDLTNLEDLSYSAFMRELRQNANKEQVMLFLSLFKSAFDKAIKDKLQKPENIALQNAIIKLNKIHKIKINKSLIKNAATSELGDAVAVGKYLANIILFTLTRIKPENRQKAIDSMKKKIYYLNENEIGMKDLPASSAMGQSITFVKHVLFNHDVRYIREVLNSIVRNL